MKKEVERKKTLSTSEEKPLVVGGSGKRGCGNIDGKRSGITYINGYELR